MAEATTRRGGRPLRICLISPKGPLYRRGGIFKQTLRYMPLTFPTLAGLLPDDVPVSLQCIDEGWADVDPDRIDADLVGMTVITGTASRAYALSAALRGRGIPVVLGGPHVTLAPEDAVPHADSIVVGYAEETWPQLVRDAHAGKLAARYDQRADLKLTGYPLPRREVLPRHRYLTADVFEATRSCIHACEFCVAPSAWGRKPLQKPVDAIVDDIRSRRARRAIFVDLNLIADRAYALRLFTALRPLGVQWYGLATTRLGKDPELLSLMAESGCRGLLFGFESIHPENLRRAAKGFNHPDAYARLVQQMHDHGIAVQGCFVFGMDEDTPELCRETARFAVEAGIDLPRFAIATPFPGTPLYEKLQAQDRILTRDWELYDGQHVVFRPARMDAGELQAETEAAWRYAYSVRSIARRLRVSAASWPTAIATNLGYRHYAHNLRRFYTCDWALTGDPFAAVAPRPASASGRARRLPLAGGSR